MARANTTKPTDDQTQSKYLTSRQAAEYLRLSPRTLETMRWRGSGPPFAKYGDGRSARVVYDRERLDQWVASRTRESTSTE